MSKTENVEEQPKRLVFRPSFAQATLWLYGLLAALAIEQAAIITFEPLIRVLDESSIRNTGADLLAAFRAEAFRIEAPRILIIARFLAFVLVITRFYLGSVHFYDLLERSNVTVKIRDILIGTIHYCLFLAAALSIDTDLGTSLPLFIVFLFGVLAYDSLWYLLSIEISVSRTRGITVAHNRRILSWAILNIISIFAAVGIAHSGRSMFSYGDITSELVVLCVISVFSIIDIDNIATDRNLLGLFLKYLINLFPNASD